jgi:hypothetical protein
MYNHNPNMASARLAQIKAAEITTKLIAAAPSEVICQEYHS